MLERDWLCQWGLYHPQGDGSWWRTKPILFMWYRQRHIVHRMYLYMFGGGRWLEEKRVWNFFFRGIIGKQRWSSSVFWFQWGWQAWASGTGCCDIMALWAARPPQNCWDAHSQLLRVGCWQEKKYHPISLHYAAECPRVSFKISIGKYLERVKCNAVIKMSNNFRMS